MAKKKHAAFLSSKSYGVTMSWQEKNVQEETSIQ